MSVVSCELDAVCFGSTLLCPFSFVCKDAVMCPDPDLALVLVIVEG